MNTMDQIEKKGILLKTIPEYAKEMGVARQTVYEWIKKKKVETKEMFGKTLIVVK